jgi:hypothetical protein
VLFRVLVERKGGHEEEEFSVFVVKKVVRESRLYGRPLSERGALDDKNHHHRSRRDDDLLSVVSKNDIIIIIFIV